MRFLSGNSPSRRAGLSSSRQSLMAHVMVAAAGRTSMFEYGGQMRAQSVTSMFLTGGWDEVMRHHHYYYCRLHAGGASHSVAIFVAVRTHIVPTSLSHIVGK